MEIKELNKLISYERKSAWKENEQPSLEFSKGYMQFLDAAKTERECVAEAVASAKEKGFQDLAQQIASGKKIQKGEKFFYNHQNKCVILFVMGQAPLSKGMNITAAHIDSPRLDLKAVPFYEDANLAMMKTHYYGGIKKYQWTAVPLSMHGVIYTSEGNRIDVSIGENDDDPVFFVSDLLVHLAADQMAKTAALAVTGEQLNVIVGNIPFEDEEIKTKVKFNAIKILHDTYGLKEEDFMSAEIEIVPAGKARHVGFDRSMIAAYGHDDRVCAYPALQGIFDIQDPIRTCVCILADKEEIGSVGSTGLEGKFFENILAEVIELSSDSYSELELKRAMANSYVLSMDVSSAYDPNFPEAFDRGNTGFVGNGAIIEKYSGVRGKAGSNDAHSEYLHKIMKLFNDNNVPYQTGELGKVDQGGGGTVAYMLANYGAYTVDYGVGVLSMHAPYELISKADLYSAYLGSKCFYQIKD